MKHDAPFKIGDRLYNILSAPRSIACVHIHMHKNIIYLWNRFTDTSAEELRPLTFLNRTCGRPGNGPGLLEPIFVLVVAVPKAKHPIFGRQGIVCRSFVDI